MKFELTYADGSKVNVEMDDVSFRELLNKKAEVIASQKAEADHQKRGIVTSVKVV